MAKALYSQGWMAEIGMQRDLCDIAPARCGGKAGKQKLAETKASRDSLMAVRATAGANADRPS